MGPRSIHSPTDPARRATAKPDPTRLRFALAVGGLAALSALVTVIVGPPAPAAPAGTTVASATLTRQRPIQYVQLAPGASAPPGAKVIDATAPKPITIVTQLPAPVQQTVVVRTTQSGKVLP